MQVTQTLYSALDSHGHTPLSEPGYFPGFFPPAAINLNPTFPPPPQHLHTRKEGTKDRIINSKWKSTTNLQQYSIKEINVEHSEINFMPRLIKHSSNSHRCQTNKNQKLTKKWKVHQVRGRLFKKCNYFWNIMAQEGGGGGRRRSSRIQTHSRLVSSWWQNGWFQRWMINTMERR